MSFREYLAFRGVVLADDSASSSERYNIRYLLDEYLIYGGYPEVVLSELSAKLRILSAVRLLIDQDLYQRIVTEALRFVECMYDWESIASHMMEINKEMAAS